MKISKTIQEQIVDILQWDEDRYSKYVLECGNAYLYAYIKNEAEEVIAQIKRSRIFWNWWKINWQLRDLAFIESISAPIKKDVARQVYQSLHDPATLAAELFPDGTVLGESYAAMIEELNQEVLA